MIKEGYEMARLQHVLAIAPALLAIGGTVFGAGQAAQDDGAPAAQLTEVGTTPIVTEKITLDFFAPQNPYITDIETNDFTVYLEDLTNIHINWDMVATDSLQEKLSLELAAGQLPDVFFGVNADGALGVQGETRYGVQEGVFMPLNDLIEEQMVNFPGVLDRYPQLEPIITAVDGNIYGLPKVEICGHCEYALKMWINTHWLDVLGLEMPTTTEEFYDVLVAFRDGDPNGNGEADEIPLTGATDGWNSQVHPFLINAFIYDSTRPVGLYIENDTTVRTNVNDSRYRDALAYMNRLYEEELLHASAFTQTSDQLWPIVNGEVERVGAVPNGATILFVDPTHPAYRNLFAMPPLEGPEGFRTTTYWLLGGTIMPLQFVMSVDNAYPEASIRWVDLFYDVWFQLRKAIGVEGEDWRRAEPGETTLEGDPAAFKAIRPPVTQPQNKTWVDIGVEYLPVYDPDYPPVGPAGAAPEDMFSNEGDAYGLLLYEATKVYWPFKSETYSNPPQLKLMPDEADQLKTITVELETYIRESRVRFITGDLDLESDWDRYVESLDDIGLPRYLEIMQRSYTRQTQ